MALIHHNDINIYAGVSRQSIDLRPEGQCQEMINCYPSIQAGVRRRNPTVKINSDVLVEDEQFLHTYDRGLSGESSEQYLITIDRTNNLRVFDVVANKYATVNYTGNALKYLESSNPEIGFTAITVKDTTFIANRDIVPTMVGDIDGTKYYKSINFNIKGYSSNYNTLNNNVHRVNSSNKKSLAPSRIKTIKGIYSIRSAFYTIYSEVSLGALISITIDGTIYKYQVGVKYNKYNAYPETIFEMRANIYNMLLSKIDQYLYKVELGLNNSIIIYRIDGADLSVSTSCEFPSTIDIEPPARTSASRILYESTSYETINKLTLQNHASVTWSYENEYNIGSSFTTSITGGTGAATIKSVSNYDQKAFIWIKQVSVDTTFPYTFTLSLRETSGTVIGTTTSNAATANGVASALATWANGLADFTAVSDGSVCKITRDSGIDFNIVISDTYGSQASSSWKGSIKQIEDLPKSFPFVNTVVKIDGVQTLDSIAYWVKYDGNQWVESKDPNMLSIINRDTMPHKLTRNADYTFTLSHIDWDSIKVGDSDSQVIPEFIGNQIKDLFFIGGRLGILTKNGISLSQQGVFYNFFRTTVLSLLDDSPIATYIDSSKSVGLEYASELQGNIVLFGDKLQFAIDTSKAITPSTISVQPISGFEINRNVKPISIGDSIFFLVSNNGYSSLMEMNKTTVSMNIRANDVSAHVPTYIDSDIIQIVSSQRDNCVFLRSRNQKDTIYVYKHYGTESDKKQMAWSKWVFNMEIKSIFVFDKELYIFGLRYDSSVPIDEYSLNINWDDSKYWSDVTSWLDNGIALNQSFEKIDIEPYGVESNFMDIGTTKYNSEIELSEWVIAQSKVKDTRGTLLIKTAEISSEDNSNFYLSIEDKERGTTRNIPALYTVRRKPFISGNSKNMKIKISSIDNSGFQINSISLEGQYNVRSKRV